LQDGDIAKAISTLSRGADLTAAAPLRARFTLTLAIARTLSDEPQSALPVLASGRDALAAQECVPAATFISAYARYRQAVLRDRLLRQDHELVAALMQLPVQTRLGAYGPIVIARAFADLGMWEQTVQTLLPALPSLQGPLAHEAKHRLAEALTKVGNNAEAVQFFEELTKDEHRFTASAHLHLARLDLKADRPDACVSRLRDLLSESSALDVAEVLTLLGRAYERKGDFTRAATCYAGTLPP
jgi:tetratricopeptide (TPR) repeat protein